MELITQHTKKIMEDCKKRAREAGLSFDKESLEYIVTNKDLLELTPKVMIPTLYDYWVHDVEVLKGHGQYKLYPSNPYETVINSRPAISFYNDNNPDWMNVMIFYHVLAHIDFFQNNKLFEHTWNDDFVGQALADKRLIASLRSEHGRWLDYAIEFSRSTDNLVGYFDKLASLNYPHELDAPPTINYYFEVFLQEDVKVPKTVLYKEIERYNSILEHNEEVRDSIFFSEIKLKYPEFQSRFDKYCSQRHICQFDIMEFIRDNSSFLKKEENQWFKLVMSIVRNSSMYFQPQIRTKIINEGWASYWHDELFRTDSRICGHEVDYAKLNAGVTAISKIGLNPYAIGLRLIQYIEELADKGKLSYEFQKLTLSEERKNYDIKTGKGKESIFLLRKYFSDFMLINTFIDQDFVDKHELFVVGERLDESRGVIQYYIKSKKAEDYKQMLLENLYHPPKITVDLNKTNEENLHLIKKKKKK
ncbi:MAG: SpoVR family protein, partial [Bacteroidia bacterium]|nr:SpoVR family protein [Bacteroidia bacterium]